MKQKEVCQSVKSNTLYIIESQVGDKVTLRNPDTGEMREIKSTTLKRSYKTLSQEEIKMNLEEKVVAEGTQETVEEVKVVNSIDFTVLLECADKKAFEEALAGVAVAEGIEEILASEDIAYLKKEKGNAALCFRENMNRFLKGKTTYTDAVEALAANEADLDLVKAKDAAEASLQKFTNKMAKYLGKVVAIDARIAEVTPAEPVAEETATPAEEVQETEQTEA